MKVIADICVIPITGQVSLRKEIALAHRILKETGLPVQLHSYGTNIEGDYDVVMEAVKTIHQTLHRNGVLRINTTLKIGSRIDKERSLVDKISAIHQELS